MFNKYFESLDKTAKDFLAATISTIRDLVRKYGKTCFEKACTELLKNPKAIIQWQTDEKNALQPTKEAYLAQQYLILTALHDDYIDRTTVLPIYFTDAIEQNEETAHVHHIISAKYYAVFRDTKRLKEEAYITDALKAIEADLETAGTAKKTPLYKKAWPYVTGAAIFLAAILAIVWYAVDLKERFYPK